jgi:acetyltransferase-like isoleucine patch superfamily enzyme
MNRLDLIKKRIFGVLKGLSRIRNWSLYVVDLYMILVKVPIWKKNGICIGENVRFLGLPIISNEENAKLSIGNNCLICSRSRNTALGVSHEAIFRTLRKGAEIQIGNNVRLSGTTICSAKSVQIGDRCVIGSDVIIADTDFHSLDSSIRCTNSDKENALYSPIEIGTDCFIGARTIILKGVKLGNRVVVGAGSVVTKSYDADSIICGNPAKKIR